MKIKIIAAFLATVFLTGCGQKTPESPPTVTIDADGVSVSNITNISAWDNTIYLLDETASDWISEYGEPFKEKFGESAEPLYERLARYFQILETYGFF